MAALVTRVKALTVAAALIIAPAEGLRQYAYKDPVGIPTACFGATKGIKMGQRFTIEECKEMLNRDTQIAVETVLKYAPDAPDRVIVGFASAVYNLGPKIVADTNSSTAARFLKAKEWDKACNQLPRWDKARVAGVLVALPGLTKRRAHEEDVCLHGSD